MTVIDPFAEAPAEEAQTTPEPTASPWEEPPAPKSAGTVLVDGKPNLSGLEASEQVRVTFKSGSAYDDPWITTDFPSIAVAHERLTDNTVKTQLSEIFGVVVPAANAFQKARGGSKPAPQGGNTGGRGNAPQGATEAPAWAPPKPYADAVYKTGVSKKNGKTWHAWMPPEKDDPREPLFFYPN